MVYKRSCESTVSVCIRIKCLESTTKPFQQDLVDVDHGSQATESPGPSPGSIIRSSVRSSKWQTVNSWSLLTMVLPLILFVDNVYK